MRNDDFNESKASQRPKKGSILSRAKAAASDPTTQRQQALEKQRLQENAKNKSRMGGIMARASAKPTSERSPPRNGKSGPRSLSNFSRPKQQLNSDLNELGVHDNAPRYGRHSTDNNNNNNKVSIQSDAVSKCSCNSR